MFLIGRYPSKLLIAVAWDAKNRLPHTFGIIEEENTIVGTVSCVPKGVYTLWKWDSMVNKFLMLDFLGGF